MKDRELREFLGITSFWGEDLSYNWSGDRLITREALDMELFKLNVQWNKRLNALLDHLKLEICDIEPGIEVRKKR